MMPHFMTSTKYRQVVISIDCLCLIINFYVQPSLIHTKLISGWMMIQRCLQNHVHFIHELHERKKVKKQKKVNYLIFFFFYFRQSHCLKPTRLWVLYGYLHLTAESKVKSFFSPKKLFVDTRL